LTGHAEVVLVVHDPARLSFDTLLATFWENHDPTQGMRQGNDLGTQYRSAIFCATREQYDRAIASRDAYQQRLNAAGYGPITTEIVSPAPPFHYAEDDHQQYLAKHPGGYCGLGGTGVRCAIGTGA
jgi:peptide-methionine (S)-S-oxide reductase